ncbi:MAG: YihY/virulence factor BrkB family protein [Clostridia bacterium]|nr:YihY/virulence factor BrkB family protein [Clostridia bacterium]
MMQWIARVYRQIRLFFNYPLSAFAAQTSFSLILSAFPFTMLLFTLMGYVPGLEQHMLQSEVGRFMPKLFEELVNRIFQDIAIGRNLTLISVTALSALFAASNGFASMIRGMNMVYGIQEARTFWRIRLLALLCTVVFMSAMLLTLLLMVFGDHIIALIHLAIPRFSHTQVPALGYRIVLICIFLTVMFILVYKTMPNRKSSVKHEFPGALVAAGGWLIFSFIYSIFLSHISTYLYGSLTAAVFMMLWIYCCIYILFVGAQINCWLRLKRRQRHKGE